MVVSYREFIVVTLASVFLALLIVAAIWPTLRNARTLLTIGVAAALGIVLWNVALNVTNATGLNVDSPFLGLSAQDVGSGVAAFIFTLVALRLQGYALARSAMVAAVVGVVTIAVDLFA